MPVHYTRERYGWNLHRFLYDWVLAWAESPFGAIALFILALAESSFFPIPPDVLLIALVLGAREKAWRYAAICSIASIMGGMLGYAIGYALWYTGGDFSSIAMFFFEYIPGFTVDEFNRVAALYEEFGFWIVFTAGFTPLPYKVITITAGVAKIDLGIFVVASLVSRSLRFFLVAGLIWKFGSPIREFIEKRFNLLAIVFVVLLVGGFAVIKYAF
ncbi:MAG TPA: YqaA family protein [Spirochaetota bacterium]|nr:YqaA family protein [Spirochaetota bacterium]